MSDGDDDGPCRLRGAQADIRDAFVARDSGLFTLSCVPGAGKSVTTDRVVAETLVRRYRDGDATPERAVVALSFNRDEAAGIAPGVCEHIAEIVAHDLVAGAGALDERDVRYLTERVRRSPFVGTIDAVLGGVLRDIASDCGFDGVPDVGADAVVDRVHATCYDALSSDPDLAARLDRLADAYPPGEYDDGVPRMLRDALDYCRNRRLSTAAFRGKLADVRGDVYAEGCTDSFADVAAAVERTTGARLTDDDRPSPENRTRLVEADRRLYDAWETAIDDFCTALDAYRRRYRAALRAEGVVSHTDVAYLVATYFDGEAGDGVDDAYRDRVRARYTSRIEDVVVDEAQDVSRIQHDALAHLITPDARVLCAGDPRQLVYEWRHADPSLFDGAVRDDTYLGVEWPVAEHETANTTYRCRPDVAAAIDAVCESALTDPAKGAGVRQPDYPRLDAFRDDIDDADVHVAAFRTPNARPGTERWVAPDDRPGEAALLARVVASGRADGTFTDADGDPASVTVLFRSRSKMAAYAAAFEAEGLRVRNASAYLFDDDAVTAVVAVLAWLDDPSDGDRVARLLNEPALGLDGAFARHDDVDAVRANAALDDAQRDVLDALCDLRDRRPSVRYRPAAATVEDVVHALALRADPHDRTDSRPARRAADLDALTDLATRLRTDDDIPSVAAFVDLVAPYRDTPRDGPTQPSVHGDDADVVFRTIHSAKGDEDDVVALADPGGSVWFNGPQGDRLLTRGPTAALAPPTNCDVPADVTLPPFERGLYDPGDADDGPSQDVGLRWATAHWRDELADSGDPTPAGPASLVPAVAGHRAEEWRALYVALTRTRDHLVLPLPTQLPFEAPRERWLDTVRDALAFDGRQDTYAHTDADHAFTVGVNDVDPGVTPPSNPTRPRPNTATPPPRPAALPDWCPRFPQPSTLYPLAADPDRYVLPHLLGRALHTDTNDVPDDLPLTHETLGPDDVGTVVHDVLTRAIRRGLPDRRLRDPETQRRLLDAALDTNDHHPASAERDGLRAFLADSVIEDFLDSDLRARVLTADHVAVEHPVGGLVRVDGVEFELNGRADVLCRTDDGVHVADVKVSLAEPTPTTEKRYRLQSATYARLLESERATDVSRSVETFGVARDTYRPQWDTDVVDVQLATFL